MQKIQTIQATEQFGGLGEEVEIGFEANAVAFYAQISGLATDKIGYPIRELDTNAWDATRDRYGDDVPQDRLPHVKLPTNLDPTFRVRDYGYGMSHEAMHKVYAKMYASTKREDANQVGGWGLGRFSPFAYLLSRQGGANYTVTSRCEGVKRIYVISLNAQGKPNFKEFPPIPLAEDEETGLEVQFTVDRADIHEFHRRAKQILWSFQPRPLVTPSVGWNEQDVVLDEGRGWTLYGSGVPFQGPQIKMGCVMYPLDQNQIELPSLGMINMNENVVFDVPIGSVSPTLSREGLAYDDRTKAKVVEAITAFDAELTERIQNQISDSTDLFAAAQKFETLGNRLMRFRYDRLNATVKWKHHNLRGYANTDLAKMRLLHETWNAKNLDRFEAQKALRLADCVGVTVAVEHRPYRSIERLVAADLLGKKVLWIRVEKHYLERVIDLLGNPNYIVLDEVKLPKMERVTITGRPRTMRKRRLWIATKNEYQSGQIDYNFNQETDDIDLAEGGYYLYERKTGRYSRTYRLEDYGQPGGGWLHDSTLKSAMREALAMGILKPGEKVLIKTDNDVLDPTKWKSLASLVIPALKRRINPKMFTGLHGKSANLIDRNQKWMIENGDFAIMPEDIAAFIADGKELIAKLSGDAKGKDKGPSVSDKAYATLQNLGVSYEKPQVECPIQALKVRWSILSKKYSLMHAIFHTHGGWYSNMQAKTYLAHYFELLARPAQAGEAEAPEGDDA